MFYSEYIGITTYRGSHFYCVEEVIDLHHTILMRSLKRGKKSTRNDTRFHYEQSTRKRLREENFSLKSRLESLEDKYEPMKKENEALKVRVKPTPVDEMFKAAAGFPVGYLHCTQYCRKL